MANLKEIRTRISSVISTRQITSAMKMVSAAKLRKAQNAVLAIRPYSQKLNEILSNVCDKDVDFQDNPYAQARETNKILMVLISSNRGLCGAFNSNVVRKTLSLLQTTYQKQFSEKNIDFILAGKKSFDMLKNKNFNILETPHQLLDHLQYENIAPLAEKLMNFFVEKKYDKILVIYNQFRNAAFQILTVEQFLPISPKEIAKKTSKFRNNYIIEPDKDYIVKVLIPKALKIQLHKAFLDSVASEHGARMTAMHKATDNAGDILRELRLNYNKARQAAITKEILEIVGGSEALSK